MVVFIAVEDDTSGVMVVNVATWGWKYIKKTTFKEKKLVHLVILLNSEIIPSLPSTMTKNFRLMKTLSSN
jgi:chromatin remodeling complex protein RSC6